LLPACVGIVPRSAADAFSVKKLSLNMRAAQRAVGLLLTQSGSSVLKTETASSVSSATRAFSSAYTGPYEVKGISEEWYLRQRKIMPLGNRIPHWSADAWVAPNAVVVGDVDLLDRVGFSDVPFDSLHAPPQ
jgi:hypothetical protein